MGTLVLSFDDAKQSVYDHGFPLMAARGMRGCVFVPTDYIGQVWDYGGTASPCMGAPALLALQEAGWEIGTHTHTHRNLIMLSPRQIEREMTTSIGVLRALGIRSVDTLAYPGGMVGAHGVEACRRHVRMGRLLRERPLTINTCLNMTIVGHDVSERTYDESVLRTFLNALRTAAGFGVLTFHDLSADAVRDPRNQLSLAHFGAIIEIVGGFALTVTTFAELQQRAAWPQAPASDPALVDTVASYSRQCYGSIPLGYGIAALYRIEGIRRFLNRWYYRVGGGWAQPPRQLS